MNLYNFATVFDGVLAGKCFCLTMEKSARRKFLTSTI